RGQAVWARSMTGGGHPEEAGWRGAQWMQEPAEEAVGARNAGAEGRTGSSGTCDTGGHWTASRPASPGGDHAAADAAVRAACPVPEAESSKGAARHCTALRGAGAAAGAGRMDGVRRKSGMSRAGRGGAGWRAGGSRQRPRGKRRSNQPIQCREEGEGQAP
ncbi:hypothetical protein H4R20_007207, partial [Coemansia guatemalensis]